MKCGAPSHECFLQCQSIVMWAFITEIQHRLEQKAPDIKIILLRNIYYMQVYIDYAMHNYK